MSDDPVINPLTYDSVDLIRLMGERIKSAGSQAAFAREIDVTPAYVSLVMSGERPIGIRMIHALGLRRVIRYEPIRKAAK